MKAHSKTRREALKIIGGSMLVSAMPFPVVANEMTIADGDIRTKERRIYKAYRSFWPELDMTKKFKELGINTRCFFASNTINSIGFEYCKYPLIWLGQKKYDFSAYDRQVEDLLSANPEVEFICMIDLNTPYWLTRRLAYDSFSAISHAASDKRWIDITTEWMLDFIAYSEKKYGDKITAYVLSGGGTSEWYESDLGLSSRLKNQAWRRWCADNGYSLGDDVPSESSLKKPSHDGIIYDPETEMDKIQYWRFHNEVISNAILHFTREARLHISKNKEIGIFFAYSLGNTNGLSFGHLDYERVIASPDIDFFISPGTYADRVIGGGSSPQLVHGTLTRYGKRYLHEIDHRTHLVSRFRAGEDWNTQEDDDAGLKREAAYALITHASLWWFDMWGGWYQATATQNLIKRLTDVADQYISDHSKSMAQVLFVVDPQSAYYINGKASMRPRYFSEKLARTSAPYDVYSFNDIPYIDLSQYKVVCFPGTFLITHEREEMLRRYVLKGNRTVVWAYAPGICDGTNLDIERIKKWTGVEYATPGPVTTRMEEWKSVYVFNYDTITPFVLKQIMKDAGVHLYTDEENSVYANERLLAIHVKNGGVKKVSLLHSCKRVIDVLSGEVVAKNTSEFSYRFKTPDTVIFKIEK